MNDLKYTASRIPKKNVQTQTLNYCSIELYEVSDSYDSKQVIQNIKTYCENVGGQYVIALHNKDIFSCDTFNNKLEIVGHKGKEKASHYHIALSLPYRVVLSDLALKFNIESRWIMPLKNLDAFDNMIIYYSHYAYDEKEKHHYNPADFDSNIKPYCIDVVNRWLDNQKKQFIVNEFMDSLVKYDNKLRLRDMYMLLYAKGYEYWQIKQNYTQLKDLLTDHNINIDHYRDVDNEVERKLLSIKIKDKKCIEHLEKLVDEFGLTKYESNGKTYILTNAKEIKK